MGHDRHRRRGGGVAAAAICDELVERGNHLGGDGADDPRAMRTHEEHDVRHDLVHDSTCPHVHMIGGGDSLQWAVEMGVKVSAPVDLHDVVSEVCEVQVLLRRGERGAKLVAVVRLIVVSTDTPYHENKMIHITLSR
eukprot:TRINITY_DN71517_c0_g1_i1.p2 TRINITY_DN71517_c0_g1~~TRINITY_DN71517_c0_g1_i1.p2  ORF type:complete len:137 (-),score=20.75 TRINITY_DN71517_c0_g1_i1:343-753(-)